MSNCYLWLLDLWMQLNFFARLFFGVSFFVCMWIHNVWEQSLAKLQKEKTTTKINIFCKYEGENVACTLDIICLLQMDKAPKAV